VGGVSPITPLHYFHFTIKHKFDKMNKGANALSRRHLLLFEVNACIPGPEHLKYLYEDDEDFGRSTKNVKGTQTNL